MAERFCRWFVRALFSPIPNLALFLCILIFPPIQAVNRATILLTYLNMALAFGLSRIVSYPFAVWYHRHYWLTESVLAVLGITAIVLHARAPGPLEPLCFGAASLGYGCWLWSYWDDDLYEMIHE